MYIINDFHDYKRIQAIFLLKYRVKINIQEEVGGIVVHEAPNKLKLLSPCLSNGWILTSF
ncbi:hypothetical protein J6TS2_04990 [Heyndrickxia sporothermodurans]|nr:hypothetical protein J6TS2_04990 [Heyndrickxia sporothermodurans]